LNLIDKEYSEIFNDKNEEKYKKFFNDFPYKITIKGNFDSTEDVCLFNGRNKNKNLNLLNIKTDEDPITSILEDEDYCLNLILNPASSFSKKNFNLNSCITYIGEDVGTQYDIEVNYTLDDLLEYFCSNENLEEGNEWNCSKCKKRVKATKKFSFFYLPRILIICLNRFSRAHYGYGKNDQFIDFPLENLDMGGYICESGPDKNFAKYDLFAVSQHYGQTSGGHYTAICKNFDGRWYHYNDSSVSIDSAENAVSSAAYVLFYRRKNW